MAIALVAHPTLGTLSSQLGDALPVTGIYYPARTQPKDATLPFFADLTAMLAETGASICAFLSPYDGIEKDVERCLAVGVDVLCGGPLPKIDSAPGSGDCPRCAIGAIHHFSPLFTKARQQRENPSLGDSVYLRLVAGAQSPGLLPAWWAVCNQWALALDLLGETPPAVYLSANNRGRAYHVALTATAPSGTIIQIAVAPQRRLAEFSLIGRGGSLAASATQGGLTLAGAQSTQVLHDATPPPELAWMRAFYEDEAPPATDESSFGTPLLQGLRRALRQRQPISIDL